ncbi:MAG: hypothetical protein RR382_03200 [Tannerellaceae bacterium]
MGKGTKIPVHTAIEAENYIATPQTSHLPMAIRVRTAANNSN